MGGSHTTSPLLVILLVMTVVPTATLTDNENSLISYHPPLHPRARQVRSLFAGGKTLTKTSFEWEASTSFVR